MYKIHETEHERHNYLVTVFSPLDDEQVVFFFEKMVHPIEVFNCMANHYCKYPVQVVETAGKMGVPFYALPGTLLALKGLRFLKKNVKTETITREVVSWDEV